METSTIKSALTLLGYDLSKDANWIQYKWIPRLKQYGWRNFHCDSMMDVFRHLNEYKHREIENREENYKLGSNTLINSRVLRFDIDNHVRKGETKEDSTLRADKAIQKLFELCNGILPCYYEYGIYSGGHHLFITTNCDITKEITISLTRYFNRFPEMKGNFELNSNSLAFPCCYNYQPARITLNDDFSIRDVIPYRDTSWVEYILERDYWDLDVTVLLKKEHELQEQKRTLPQKPIQTTKLSNENADEVLPLCNRLLENVTFGRHERVEAIFRENIGWYITGEIIERFYHGDVENAKADEDNFHDLWFWEVDKYHDGTAKGWNEQSARDMSEWMLHHYDREKSIIPKLLSSWSGKTNAGWKSNVSYVATNDLMPQIRKLTNLTTQRANKKYKRDHTNRIKTFTRAIQVLFQEEIGRNLYDHDVRRINSSLTSFNRDELRKIQRYHSLEGVDIREVYREVQKTLGELNFYNGGKTRPISFPNKKERSYKTMSQTRMMKIRSESFTGLLRKSINELSKKLMWKCKVFQTMLRKRMSHIINIVNGGSIFNILTDKILLMPVNESFKPPG